MKIPTIFLRFRRLVRRSWLVTLSLVVIGVIASEAGPFAYVTSLAENLVAVIDTATNDVVTTVPVGVGPQGVALTPDGAFAYVANFDDDSVSVIDTATNTVEVTVSVGDRPLGVAITPDGAFAYVAVWDVLNNQCVGGVWVIDTADNSIQAIVSPLGGCPTWVAITPDGAFAYVTNFSAGNVAVIDTATYTVAATVSVGDGPYGAAITPDGAFAYVANSESSSVSVIKTATNTVETTVLVGSGPRGVAVTPDGAFVYVANFASDSVSVIKTATNTVEATVSVGDGPQGVAVTPNGARAYVTNRNTNIVSVIDTATNRVVAEVVAGAVASWVVISAALDTTPPDTSILSGPAEGSVTNSTQATFTFSGTDDQSEPADLTFTCSLDGGTFATCASPQTYSDLADGQHTFAVQAVDGTGNTDASPATRAWMVDSTPPIIFLAVSPQVLWPPLHQLVAVTVAVSAGDNSEVVSIILLSVTSSEPDNGASDGDTADDIQGADIGTLDTQILLRAERSGGGPGRTYTLTYQVTDLAGNTTTSSVTVTVPARSP